MKKPILFFLIPVLLSCASPPPGKAPVSGGGFPASQRFGDRLVFLGVSGGYYVSRNRAVKTALTDAARRLSFYHSVEAFIRIDETYRRQLQGVQIDTGRTLIHDEEYEKYAGALEFDPEQDVIEENNVLFVRAGYRGGDSAAANYVRPPSDGKPAWIENQPARIGGQYAAAGFAAKRVSYKNTVTASYEDAVFAMVQNHLYAVTAGQTEGGGAPGDFSVSYASGIVKGFYVLETWTDPDTGGVWTLAIAREIKSAAGIAGNQWLR